MGISTFHSCLNTYLSLWISKTERVVALVVDPDNLFVYKLRWGLVDLVFETPTLGQVETKIVRRSTKTVSDVKLLITKSSNTRRRRVEESPNTTQAQVNPDDIVLWNRTH